MFDRDILFPRAVSPFRLLKFWYQRRGDVALGSARLPSIRWPRYMNPDAADNIRPGDSTLTLIARIGGSRYLKWKISAPPMILSISIGIFSGPDVYRSVATK